MQLYALTDGVLTPNEILESRVLSLLKSGVRVIQYRNKFEKCGHDEALLLRLVEACEGFGAKLLINDDALLAARVGAHGVHVGREDGGVKRAREILGEKAVVGASCYASVESAARAVGEGASYVAFGAVFASVTKSSAVVCGLDVVARARAVLGDFPVCVIGGINASNISQVARFCPDYIAVVSALYAGGSVEENVARLVEKMRAEN